MIVWQQVAFSAAVWRYGGMTVPHSGKRVGVGVGVIGNGRFALHAYLSCFSGLFHLRALHILTRE
jgi:hypothetical protein